MVGIKDVAPDLLMPEGCLTRASPDANAAADIARGREVLHALSPFDIGQAAIVIDGHVVGVETSKAPTGCWRGSRGCARKAAFAPRPRAACW